jgi:glycerol-3-phosphate dehydrogenase (NAD(P)+)
VKPLKIGIIGNGSWATALLKILCDNEIPKEINWWLRHQDDIDFVKKHLHNPRYLTDMHVELNKVNLENELEKVIDMSDYLVLAVPSAFVHSTLKQCDISLFKDKVIISAVKGVNSETHQIISHYFETVWNIDSKNIAAIAGPCHAEEVAMEKLSYLTIASSDEALAQKISNLLDCHYILTKTSDDIYGIEYASVLKNVYAIACGICHGLGYGDNFQSVLVSASIREIETFLDACVLTHRDVKSNAYLGDLLVTAYSQFSRNRTFGNMLGKGYNVKSAQLEMNMIAEGYYATKTMNEINSEIKANMPILEAVYDIIYNQVSAKNRMHELTKALI